MKRILSVFFTILLTSSICVLSVKAISVNYCDFFEKEIRRLHGSCELETQEFNPDTIRDYTFLYSIKNKQNYITNSKNEYGNTINYYSIPANVFEDAAKLHFNFDTQRLRNYFANPYLSQFNASTNTYEFDDYVGGYGGGYVQNIFGYKQSGDKYTIWFIETEHYDRDANGTSIIPNGAVENKDYIFVKGEGAAPIMCFSQATVIYDGTNIKFLSYKEVDSLPDENNLITLNTKIDISPENTSSTNQSGTVQSNSSKPNSFNQSGTVQSNSSKPNSSNQSQLDSSADNKSYTSTKPNTNATQSNIVQPSFSETDTFNQSQAQGSTVEESSSQTSTEVSISTNDNKENIEKETSNEGDNELNNTNNKFADSKNNTIVIIIILTIIVLLGVSISVCYFFILKKK